MNISDFYKNNKRNVFDVYIELGILKLVDYINECLNSSVNEYSSKIVPVDIYSLIELFINDDDPIIPTDNTVVYTIEKDTGKISWHEEHELSPRYHSCNFRLLRVSDVLIKMKIKGKYGVCYSNNTDSRVGLFS